MTHVMREEERIIFAILTSAVAKSARQPGMVKPQPARPMFIFQKVIHMTTDYTDQDSKLTFLFPESLGVNRFKLVEQRADHVHFFTFTLLDERPGSRLNQALCEAISGKTHARMTVIRNDGLTCSESVIVKESKPKQPNVYHLSVIGPSNRSAVQRVPQR